MKLNNKGYLIVEVILAGVLTFTMAYFLINLTLKIRNRYDDTNVETVLLNDKTVVTNEVMDDVINNKVKNVEYIANGIKITFEDGSSKDLTVVDNTITYGTYIKKFSENAIVGDVSIRRNGNYFTVEIPVATKYSNKDFGINIVGFTKEALEPLTCTLNRTDKEITANFDGNMVYYGWNADFTGDNSTSKPISLGDHTYYIKDVFGNTGSCSISIAPTALNCNLNVSDTVITANFADNMAYYGWNANFTGDNSKTKTTSVGIHTYYIKDTVGNTGSCSIEIVNNTVSCNTGYTLNSTGDKCYKSYQAAPDYRANGHCSCQVVGGAPVESGCIMSGGNAVCSCPSGTSIITNGCSKTIVSYSCNAGDEQIGYSCTNYIDIISTCPSGYTRINNTYCSK